MGKNQRSTPNTGGKQRKSHHYSEVTKSMTKKSDAIDIGRMINQCSELTNGESGRFQTKDSHGSNQSVPL